MGEGATPRCGRRCRRGFRIRAATRGAQQGGRGRSYPCGGCVAPWDANRGVRAASRGSGGTHRDPAVDVKHDGESMTA